MPWSPARRQRLEFEKALLDKYCDDRVSWCDPTGNARVEVRVVSVIFEPSPGPQGQIHEETDCPYPLSKHINRLIEV